MSDSAAAAAVEDAAATGGFEDDLEESASLADLLAQAAPVVEDEPVEVPEGARDPDAVARLIRAERKAAREANARARELEAQLKAAASPASPSVDPAAIAAAEAKALKLEIALDKGIPKSIAMRLQGSSREEMEQDAETLLAEFGSRGPGMDGGYRQDPPAVKTDPKAAHNDFIAGLLRGAQQQ